MVITAMAMKRKMKMEVINSDKLLFSPGPLTTSATVKRAMLRDLGSLDSDFLASVRNVRTRLLDLGPYPRNDYECILMQGSGTFVVESVISSAIPQDGKLLVLVNGAYGRRIGQMAHVHCIDLDVFEVAENKKFTAELVSERLASTSGFTHVAVVHCETTSGMLNQVEEIGHVVHRAGACYIVDGGLAYRLSHLLSEQMHRGRSWVWLCACQARRSPCRTRQCTHAESRPL